jgi:hypothetical protein
MFYTSRYWWFDRLARKATTLEQKVDLLQDILELGIKVVHNKDSINDERWNLDQYLDHVDEVV